MIIKTEALPGSSSSELGVAPFIFFPCFSTENSVPGPVLEFPISLCSGNALLRFGGFVGFLQHRGMAWMGFGNGAPYKQ